MSLGREAFFSLSSHQSQSSSSPTYMCMSLQFTENMRTRHSKSFPEKDLRHSQYTETGRGREGMKLGTHLGTAQNINFHLIQE